MANLSTSIYRDTLDFFKTAPPLVKNVVYSLLLIILFLFVIFLWRLSHNFIRERWRDFLFFIRDKWIRLIVKKESSRLDNLINWKLKKDFKKGEFPHAKVKIKPIDIKKDKPSVNVASFKRGTVLVLREPLKKECESENLARIISTTVIHGFLAHIKKYLSPDISTAINNVETIRQLREIGDYMAEDLFIENMQKNNPEVESKMKKLHSLRIEGIYRSIFLPYLNAIDKHFPAIQDDAIRESDDCLNGFLIG